MSIWIDDFSKTICPPRQTSQQHYDIESHHMGNWLIFLLQGNGTSNRSRFLGSLNIAEIEKKSANNKVKCSKKHKTWPEEEHSQHLHMHLCQMKCEIKHKLVLLSFLIQEVGTWIPLTHSTRNLRPTDVFLRRKVCYTCAV